MRRNLWNCPTKVRETAYKSIVRPKLEYASTAWDPYTNKDKVALERVQRKAARFCSKNYNPMSSVTDMTEDLNWESLEVRRKKARLTLLYKLSRNLVDVETNNYLLVNNETRTRGSHSFKYRVPKTTKDVFKFSFFPRTIREWNLLPEEIVFHLTSKAHQWNLHRKSKNRQKIQQLMGSRLKETKSAAQMTERRTFAGFAKARKRRVP
ncbi:Hypothetical predicted protein, partial [Paramuricea clavata]